MVTGKYRSRHHEWERKDLQSILESHHLALQQGDLRGLKLNIVESELFEKAKYLMVTIDCKPNWNYHLSTIINSEFGAFSIHTHCWFNVG